MTISNENEKVIVYEQRRKELEDFDNTKLGVKGLVDSGITHIPRIFHHPPETVTTRRSSDCDPGTSNYLIPVIDLSGPEPELVDQVRDAASKFGFFQVVNHGVPISLLDRVIGAVKGFHELPAEEKYRRYLRGGSGDAGGIGFSSNFDLFSSKAASWRDTLEVRMWPSPVDPANIPDVCREELVEWDKEVKKIAARIMELLSQGLGLSPDRLNGLEYIGRRLVAGHYYPYCPEPCKTVGISSHTDPGILTILLQDQMGGLQVMHNCEWLSLKPLHGALVVNIGDMLQMISNDEYTSGEHRVIANPSSNARVSVPVFFSSAMNENWYGPLPELVSPDKPALYRDFTFSDIFTKFFAQGLERKSMINSFRV